MHPAHLLHRRHRPHLRAGACPPRQMCRRIGCDSHPHVFRAVGYCIAHCTSPRCQHPSTRPPRRRRARRGTPVAALDTQCRGSPLLPPSLSSAHVLSHPVPLVPQRPIPLADHTLSLFVGVLAFRSQCTLNAPRGIAIPESDAVSTISHRETAWATVPLTRMHISPSFPLRTTQHPSSLFTQRFTLCLPSCCNVPSLSRVSRRHMVLVAPKRASCSTSQLHTSWRSYHPQRRHQCLVACVPPVPGGTVIVTCFYTCTSYSKDVVCVFGTT